MTIRIGIMGYGNLGRGVECALAQTPDMELTAIFSRRGPGAVRPLTPGVPVYYDTEAPAHRNDIDVMILCGGSATDLPVQAPQFAQMFHIVDSYDNHSCIPEHFAQVDEACKAAGTVGVISAGWDPGLFSLARLYTEAVLPQGKTYTFWGRGVSQGHSDAIRRIDGVADARQYTVPVPSALDAVRSGAQPELTTRQKHTRECYVVAQQGADKARIEQEIKTMPAYFADYDTTVTFITAEEMARDHAALPHGGSVIRSGTTGCQQEHSQVAEFRLQLDSNPEFTSSVLVASARAAWRMAQQGQSGCRTMLDIPPALLSSQSPEELRKHLL